LVACGAGGGGGGGFSTVTEVEAEAVNPRESVQVAPMLMLPAEAPVVLRVAVFPLPEILPPLAVHPPTVTGTLSGLVQEQLIVDVPPV
jgi:hypothetical protein